MTVIAVVICTNKGKILVSRSFVEVSRYQMEGIVLMFSKTVEKNENSSYTETEKHRFVFQLLGEGVFLLLVTSKSSNIVQDIQLQKTLFELTKEKLSNDTSMENISNKGFDLIFLYDECICAGGHAEMLSTEQATNITKMDSRDEQTHETNQQQRIQQAIKKRIEKEQQIAQQLKANQGKYTSGIEGNSTSIAPETIEKKDTETKETPSTGFNKYSGISSLTFNQSPSTSTNTKRPKGLKLTESSENSQMGIDLKGFGIPEKEEEKEEERKEEEKEKEGKEKDEKEEKEEEEEESDSEEEEKKKKKKKKKSQKKKKEESEEEESDEDNKKKSKKEEENEDEETKKKKKKKEVSKYD